MNFAPYAFPDHDTFYARLDGLPFFKTSSFFRYLCFTATEEPVRELIDPRRILGFEFQTENGWNLRDRGGPDYVWKMAQKIYSGRINPENAGGINVLQFGDVYFISHNGRHRTAAIKGIAAPGVLVPAQVQRIKPFICGEDLSGSSRCKDGRWVFENPADPPKEFKVLLSRQQRGLWSGAVHQIGTGQVSAEERQQLGAPIYEVFWTVHTAAGPYVFADDLKKAKEAYDSLNKE